MCSQKQVNSHDNVERRVVSQNLSIMPRVSIITPSYNQEKYIQRTIESVLDQDYPNIEYIIIDGKSSDNSVGYIEQYSEKIAYWVSEEDLCQSHAINKGFNKATGEIICWLNSDDMYLDSDVIGNVVNWFVDHPDHDACYGHNIYIDDNDELIYCRRELPSFSRMLLGFWNFLHQPTVFFRSNILERIRVNESFNYCFDYDLWLSISEKHRFAPSDIIVSASRWHSKSKTVNESRYAAKELHCMLAERGLPRSAGMKYIRAAGYGFLRISGVFLLSRLFGARKTILPDLKTPTLPRLVFRQMFGVKA